MAATVGAGTVSDAGRRRGGAITDKRAHVRLLALIVAVVGLVAAPPAAGEGAVLQLEGEGGHQWVAIRFVTDGRTVTGTFTVYEAELPRQAGIAVYDEDDEPLTGSSLTQPAVDDARVVVRVGVEEADTDIRHGPLGEPPTSASLSSRFTLNPTPDPMTRLAVVWAAGEGERWTFTLGGGEGVRVLGVEHGAETFLAINTDFKGGVHAEAYAVAGARAQVDTHLDVPVDGFLLGTMGRFSGAENVRFEMEQPSGHLRPCPCSSWQVAGDDTHGPGLYRFHLTGVGAGAAGLSDVFVGGASVHLPDIEDEPG